MREGLIVIDGVDASGKHTQSELLCKRLAREGYAVKRIQFPDYDQPSSALIKMYLAGEFGTDAAAVNAYAASSFYAVDRYASYKKFWKTELDAGKIVISDRYTTSNAIHQMIKLPKTQWDDYLTWLYQYEYELLGIPRPDLVLFMDMPVSVSLRLMDERAKKEHREKDIHEANRNYLTACYESAAYAADKLGWVRIHCLDEQNKLKKAEQISDEIVRLVKAYKAAGGISSVKPGI